MADGDAVDEFRVGQKALAEDALRPSQFLSRIERRADEILHARFSWRGKVIDIEFRRFTHQQANLFSKLPFAWKAILNAQEPADSKQKQEFTDEDMAQFRKFQLEVIKKAVVDAGRWKEFLEEPANEQLVPAIYEAMAAASGMTKDFDDQLEEFLTLNEYGLGYGLVLSMFNRTPSEMARLPETDVKFIQRWALKYSERLKQQQGM